MPARAGRWSACALALLLAACDGDAPSPGPMVGPPPAPGDPPTACFSVTPPAGDTQTSFLFDARCSAGDTDSTLTYLWDFDGDGTFESPLGFLPFTSIGYTVPGTLTVALRVLDLADSLADTTFHVVSVVQAVLPPELVQLTADPASNDDWPAWSPDGTKLAFQSNRSGNSDVWMLDLAARGDPVRLTTDPANDTQPAWSPDGTRIAFKSTRSDASGDLWIYTLADSSVTRLTTYVGVDEYPTWSPDGAAVAFVSTRAGGGQRDVWKVPAAGGAAVQVTTSASAEGDPAWSPVADEIAYQIKLPGNRWEIWRIGADGTGAAQVTSADSVGFVGHPTWSPAGDEVAFHATGLTKGVFRVPAAGGAAVSFLAGLLGSDTPTAPAWSPDGGKVAFTRTAAADGDQDLWVYDFGGR